MALKNLLFIAALCWSVTAGADTDVIAILETELGEIEIELYLDKAPASAGSFLQFVDEGHYDDQGFNRVVRPDNDNGSPVISVIQGGILDPIAVSASDLVQHESTDRTGVKHADGAVSLARSGASGSGATFFICIGDQPSLDFGGTRHVDGQGFAAFGRVVSGMGVVREINALKDTRSDSNPYVQNQMLKAPVRIIRAYRK